MPAVFGNVGASAGDVNDFHSSSDVDKSTLAQHHTLGSQPNQASPGDHGHDGRSSSKLYIKNLVGVEVDYVPTGESADANLTFSSTIFSGSYTIFGNLCFYQIDLDFSTVLNFGTGQYSVALPFVSKQVMQFRDGCLHDFSASRHYQISGHVAAGTNTLYLFTTELDVGRVYDLAFEQGEPITLATADSLHIAGTYQFQS